MKKIFVVLLFSIIFLSTKSTELMAATAGPITIRSDTSEYIIDDSGRFNNPMDVIHFEYFTGKTVSDWQSLGYTTVRLFITVEMKEINAGYQYIFIYRNDYSSETNNLLFDSETIEYGGGGFAKTSWGDYLFETIDIQLSSFEDDLFVIRYGASGFGEDDWANRDLRIIFEFN